MVAGARLWWRLVAVVAVIVAVSLRQVIRWQAELDPGTDPLLTIWEAGRSLEVVGIV